MRDILNPVLAILLSCFLGFLLFSALGFDGANVVWQLFVAPLTTLSQYPDLLTKAAPLILIACGLSLGFKAGIWNIGAEGQYVLGGIFATGIALLTHEITGAWILPLMLIASILGGMAWAALPAFLKNRYNVSEILSSLMLTYVAIQLLYFLLRTSWKDPTGFNFPQTVTFSAAQTPALWFGTSIHTGVFIAFIFAFVMFFVQAKTSFGFGIKLSGLAPRAARFAGYSDKKSVLTVMLISGGAAGLAGGFEVAGPFGQLVPQFPVNYGFTAIIVAFLGRLNPLGIIFAGLMIATTTIGGELAQTLYKLPSAASSVFQAMMLFILLALEHRK